MWMKRMLKILALILVVGASAPLAAHARNCELPHEKLELRCGGDAPNSYDSDADTSVTEISAVRKARNTSDIMREYREKSASYAAVISKADADYRDYVASRRR
jgi:hypothetical protein